MKTSIYGLYPAVEEKAPRVLILLREPGVAYDPQNREGNASWWNEVLEGKHKRYEECFRKWLKYVEKDYGTFSLDNVYYANIFPWGGGGKESKACKQYISGIEITQIDMQFDWSKCVDSEDTYNDKSKDRLKTIIKEVKPAYIFTCTDIFELLKNSGATLKEEKGVIYTRKNKNILKRLAIGQIDDSNDMKIYEVYHPSYFGAKIK